MSVEVSWFSALCDDDYEFLGVPDPARRSTFEHCRDIILEADRQGFDNVLLPSGYDLGIDSVAFAGGVAPLLEQIRLLVAVRCGEMWVPQLARQMATLNQMLAGRLNINIISSDIPGQALESAPRYQRTLEIMQALRTLLNGESLDMHGDFVDLTVDPPRIAAGGTCPPFYFGGLSPAARECAAAGADVFLMWPDTMDGVESIITDMRGRARAHGRQLKFGYRVHVIVRETESEARAAASRLVSKLDDEEGRRIRERSLDSASEGVRRQAELRDIADADEGYVEDNLWTGVGRARSGCGAAIVGDPDQIVAKLKAYEELGIEAFILSGYPHKDEAELFGRYVLPQLDHAPLEM